jgi:hypothetical protein
VSGVVKTQNLPNGMFDWILRTLQKVFAFVKENTEVSEVARKQNTEQKRKRELNSSNDDPVPEATVAVGSGPTEEEIRRRAYEIYLDRSGAPGDPVADWLQAERSLRDEGGQ